MQEKEDQIDIQNKVALVTGGAVRVGKAICLALAEEGAHIAINYNSSDKAARDTQKQIQDLGVKCSIFQADVSDLDQVKKMIAGIVDELGSLDILVNSASLWRGTPFPVDDYSDWHTVTSILVDGAFYCANEAARIMISKAEGAIINIVDLSAFEPWPNFTAHSVGKSAQLALNRQLALELAPNISVNAIAPGPVLPPPDYSEEQNSEIAKKTLMGRWGTAEDVAEAVVFLVQSSYITGEVIRVDGGEHFGHRKVGD